MEGLTSPVPKTGGKENEKDLSPEQYNPEALVLEALCEAGGKQMVQLSDLNAHEIMNSGEQKIKEGRTIDRERVRHVIGILID